MLDILGWILVGVALGSLTGMIPGIHPNTVIFSTLPFYFVINPEFSSFMALISGLTVSHTLHDFLPALFLKTPEAESALSTLPGLEMVQEGLGRKAFILTVIGGLTSIVVFILVLPVLFLLLSSIYVYLERVMFFILLFFLFFIILESESSFWAAIVAALSGFLGLLTLNSGFSQQFILLPVFAGLFAVPALLYSLKTDFEVPDQKKSFVISKQNIEGGSGGFLSGLLAGIVPGIGAAIATTFLTPLMNSDREKFLTGLGAVNTSDILISFLALYLIGKPRTGSSVALETVSTVTLPEVGFLIGCCIFAAGIAGILSIKNLDLYLKAVKKVKFSWLAWTTLALIFALIIYTTGIYGAIVFFTSSFAGTVAMLTNSRAACMTVLIFPALTFFSTGFI